MTVAVTMVETPNPNARKYVVDRPVQEESRGRFYRVSDEVEEPLAKSLLELEGVESVMLLPNSVTVSKSATQKWETVEPSAKGAIEAYFS